jgi:protein O-mannosyl-transferase
MTGSRTTIAWLFVLGALMVTGAIYWNGLHGGFIYDDFSFIVGNNSIKVTHSSLKEWVAAAMSFPSGSHQGRWLGMLTFGFNHYLTGMDPFGFKLTNLGIHLLNGLLVFLLLRELFNFHRALRAGDPSYRAFDGNLAAAILASLWLVLPINLTAVLYVSQRLESLSTTIGFLGLWWYLKARLAHWQGRGSFSSVWMALVVSTFFGVLTKESAVQLPLFTVCVEFVLTGGRNRQGRWDRAVLLLYGCLLLAPLAFGLVWLGGWLDGTRTYGRAFDTTQRLLTEARILLSYMSWTLVPSLDSLSLYHDDIEVSRGLLTPWTTVASVASIATLIGMAVWQRTRKPLFSLGIFWYFGGHLLTATIIPLMLAFEHRNYFPSLGLLLAAGALLFMEGPRVRTRTVAIGATCIFSFYAFTTAMRANEWSDPLRLVMAEASKRPRSPDAQFARANKLITSNIRRLDGTSMVDDGLLSLDNARRLPGAGMLFEQLLITVSAQRHQPINPAWWESLVDKLASRPPNSSDARALSNLNACFMDHFCGEDLAPLKKAYEAAMSHNSQMPTLLSVHAEFSWYLLNDKDGAERDIRRAVELAPGDINGRKNLVVLLLATDQLVDARRELEIMKSQNWMGFFDDLIASLERALDEHAAKTVEHTSKS